MHFLTLITVAIPRELCDVCEKSFRSSLMVPTLQWYTNLPNNFISSFALLTDTFVKQSLVGRNWKSSQETFTESNSAMANHYVTTLVDSSKKRSPSHSAIRKQLLIPSKRDSSLMGSFTNSSSSSIAP